MKTAIIITVVGIATLLTASLVWAHQQKGGFGPSGRGGAMVEKVSKRLELSDYQKQKLELFAEAMRSMRESRKGEGREYRQELLSLLDTASLDRGKAMELLDEKQREFNRHMNDLVTTFADFSDSLDAGQREELKEILSQRMEHRRERRHLVH
jgi:Spy/CpxP family protein refolding chaperone